MHVIERWLRRVLMGGAAVAAVYMIFFSEKPEPIGEGLSQDSIAALEDEARQSSMVISPQARKTSQLSQLSQSDRESRRQRQSSEATPAESGADAADKALTEIVATVDDGRWREAETALLALLSDHPRHEMALVEMAMLQLIDKRDPEAGRHYLERAVLVNPNNEATLNELLAVYEETGQIEQGLAFLQSIPELERQNGVIDYGIANALLQSGSPEDALVYYQRAMDRSGGNDPRLREETADAYFESGRYDEAIELYESTLEQINDQDKRRYMQIKLATTYYQKNNLEAAREILNDMLDSNPEDDLVAQLLQELQSGRM